MAGVVPPWLIVTLPGEMVRTLGASLLKFTVTVDAAAAGRLTGNGAD